MTTPSNRAVIVGASSVLGKELADELNRSVSTLWDLTLLEIGDAAGQMTAAGDEALLVQPLTPESFIGARVVFFVADAAATRAHWRQAVAAGACVVDTTGALAGEPGVATRAPLLSGLGTLEAHLDLTTEVAVACHPASLMLSFVCARLQSACGEHARLAATLLLPASEQGKDGMDELHAQTVALLSFQTLPQDLYDAQVAFNVNSEFGPEARVSLGVVSRRIGEEVQALLGPNAAARCTFHCLQAPVFHGFSASILLECDEAVERSVLEDALRHPMLLKIAGDDEAAPSSAAANGEEAMQASLRAGAHSAARAVWLWLVGDDLRLASRNAVACANELLAIRPTGPVQ